MDPPWPGRGIKHPGYPVVSTTTPHEEEQKPYGKEASGVTHSPSLLSLTMEA